MKWGHGVWFWTSGVNINVPVLHQVQPLKGQTVNSQRFSDSPIWLLYQELIFSAELMKGHFRLIMQLYEVHFWPLSIHIFLILKHIRL